jgi:hypothetical protein
MYHFTPWRRLNVPPMMWVANCLRCGLRIEQAGELDMATVRKIRPTCITCQQGLDREPVRVKQLPRQAQEIGRVMRGGKYACTLIAYIYRNRLYIENKTPEFGRLYDRFLCREGEIAYLYRIWAIIHKLAASGELAGVFGLFAT